MEGNTHKNGLLNAVVLLIAAAGAFAAARYSNLLSGQVAAAFIGVGFLVALVSWFQMRLEERERLEKLEYDELTKSPSRGTLFTEGDSEVFPAQRTREQFERFFVPAITVILVLAQAAGAWLLWRLLQRASGTTLERPAVALAI